MIAHEIGGLQGKGPWCEGHKLGCASPVRRVEWLSSLPSFLLHHHLSHSSITMYASHMLEKIDMHPCFRLKFVWDAILNLGVFFI
jgi:hypothetical protein